MARIYKTCTDCGTEFFISEKAQEFFASKPDYVLPKRCFECRQQRKGKKSAATAVVPARPVSDDAFFIPAHEEPSNGNGNGHQGRWNQSRRNNGGATFGDVWNDESRPRRRRRAKHG